MKNTSPHTVLPSLKLAILFFGVALFLGAIAPQRSFAASGSWTGLGGNANWSTAGNWSVSPAPGTTAGTAGALTGNGQDTATFNNAGNGFTTITIDSNRQIASIVFDTNTVSYTIGSAGANGGNALALFNGTPISMTSAVVGSNITETFNAPILLIPYAPGNTGAFKFANNSANSTNSLVIAGSLSVGNTTGASTLPLTLTGVAGSGTNIISGSVGNGSGTMSIQISGTSIWELSSANSTFTGGLYAGTQNPTLGQQSTLVFGASSTGPAGAPTSGPAGTGLIWLNGGIIDAAGGTQTIANNMVVNYDSGGAYGYVETFGGASNLVLTGTVINNGVYEGTHWMTLTVNNTALTTFAGGILTTNNFWGFDGSGNAEVTGTVSTGGQPLNYGGTGSLAISGSQTYNQNTDALSGTVILDGTTIANSSIGSGVVNVSTGAAYSSQASGPTTFYFSQNATLRVKGNFTIGNNGAAGLNVYGGNGTSTGQGTLSLVDGAINTLTIHSTTAGATVLTLGANSILNMEVGSSSDQIALGSGLKASVTSTVLVNITGLGGLNGATQNLITTANTAAFTTGAGNNFVLNTATGNFGGYTVALTGLSTVGDLSLTETALAATPAAAFWSGTVSGTWNSFVNGNANNTNWLTAASAGTDTHQVPGAATNVLFNASGATNVNTVLGANTTINSLEFTSAASGASDVTIGSGTFGSANGTLTITPSGTNFEGATGVGITVDSGAGTNTINSALTLGGNQTWLVNNSQSNPLTVNGAVGGAHALTIAGPGEVILSASNSYTGNTTVANGALMITGTLYPVTNSATVSVSGTGSGTALLEGTGLINAAVSVGGGTGTQQITGGTPTSNGILTLANGLTLNSGGIVYFDNVTSGTTGNFINITSGNFTANPGAIIEVPTSGTGVYMLIGDANGTISGTGNITIETLLGAPAPGNYTLLVTSGTLELSVTTVSGAQPTLTLGNVRAMAGQSGTLTGVMGNVAGNSTLTGTLADNSPAQTAGSGTLNVSSFPTNPIVVAAGTSANYTAVINNVGSSLGANIVNVSGSDGTNSMPGFVTATGTVSVLQNRIVLASTAAIGSVHVDATGTAATSLTSLGADNQNTRVTVSNGGVDSSPNGLSVTGGSPSTVFNGVNSDSRTVTGTFASLGLQTGTVTLSSASAETGGALAGELDQPVTVGYTAQVFSGQASWSSNTGGSWATNSLWGDTNAGDLNGGGAPGLAGAASIGDTATFNDVSGQSGVSTISLNGANPTLAAITFNSTNGYTIAAGSGGAITLQGAATPISVTAGDTGTINVALQGSGAGLNLIGGGKLVLGAASSYSGATQISNGILQTTTGNVLPATTSLTFGDVSNDSGQLVLGGNQAIGGGLTTVGSGASNAVFGGAGTVSTLSLNLGSSNTVYTFSGSFGGSGANQNNLALTVSGTGVQVLAGSTTYTGQTTINLGAVLQITGTSILGNTTSPALVFSNSQGNQGGVIQFVLSAPTTISPTLGGNAGNVNWSGGGFAAVGNTLTITANGGAQLVWGNNDFGGNGGNGITFGSITSNAQVILTNNINLNTGDAFEQVVYVNGTTAGSSVLLSGIISPGTGQSAFSKSGPGILYLSGANTYTGVTQVANGLLIADISSYDDGVTPGAFGIATSAISIGDAGVADAQPDPAGANIGLLINGAYIIARPVTIGPVSSTVNSISIGGTSNSSGTFSGLITTNQNFQVVQAATTGGNALNITGGITASGNADTVTFNNAGNVNVAGAIANGAGTISVVQMGTGTTTFTGPNTYTGSTIIEQGVLSVTNSNGSATGTNAVNVAPNANAAATLSGTGMISGAVTTIFGGGSNIPHIAPGVNTSGNLGGAGTLTLNGGLTIAYGSVLDFDLGTSSDLIAVNGQLTLSGGVTVNVGQASGFATGTTYTLMTYTGTLTGTTSNWTVTGAPPATYDTFTAANGVVTLVITSTAAPGNAYWSGAQGGGGSGAWNTIGNGVNGYTNWLSAVSGGTDTNQVPYGGTTNVFFIADTGSNTNTFLGANTAINSLNFTGTDATVTTGSAVIISGSSIGSGTNYTLTINATGTNGNTVGSGITTGLGAGADTINAPLILGGPQTWTLNAAPADPLTVNGAISGPYALAVAGAGELILGGNNTFTNGLTINGSVNVVLNNTGALNSTTPESVAFGVSSTGTLSLNGFSVAIGSLSSNGGAPVIQNNNGAPAVLTIGQAASGTYSGVIQDGVGASLSLVTTGPGVLTLAGANTYTGSTIVNGGELQVNGSLGAGSNVAVNSGGTLGGYGGNVKGAVTVNSGGTITGGAPLAPGTLTLGNGLTINSGGIAAFNVINSGANDEINITGNLNLNNGAIVQVSGQLITAGTYAIMTYTAATNVTVTSGSLNGITEEDIGGGSLSSNYSFAINSGTVDLVVTQSPLAIAAISITSPASGIRVMAGATLGVSGTVSNPGASNPLSGTLSNAGGAITVSGFTPGVETVAAGGASGYTATIASTGTNLGNQTFAVTVTDGSSINTSATASGTLDVLANRLVVVAGAPNYGAVHEGTAISGTIMLSSTGADNQYTRVTVADSGPDAFGISIIGGNPSGTFNGSYGDTRYISGTFTSVGAENGITLVTGSEPGLAGQTPVNVNVGITAEVFSGHATWSGVAGNSSWSTNSNWGDTAAGDMGGIGAPGLSGALSIGDTATLTDGTSEIVGGTTAINLNGVSPSLAGVTFSSGSTVYNIATGVGSGTLNIQAGGSLNVTTGKGIVSAVITGSGLTVTAAPGSDMLLSGTNVLLSGTTTVTSGTLTYAFPGLLSNQAGSTYVIDSGATLELNASTLQNIAITTGSLVFTGSGTLLKSGTGTLENHSNGGNIDMDMSAGGVIEISGGLFQSGGLGGGTAGIGYPVNGNGSIVWTNNMASLKIDSGGAIDPWNGNNITVDALLGSGTVTLTGYGAGANVINIGVANGSGTFAGTITNALGNININKEGTGIEVLTGSNSYGGYAAISGGTLRITNSTGLGFGGYSFVTEVGQHTATASNNSTLDIYGGITVNEQLTLNNGSLINSDVGTTSVFDSGIAGIDFGTDNATAPSSTTPITVTISGTGGASATAGTVAGNTAPLAGGSPQNLYTQMVNPGTGYLPGSAPTVTIVQGSGTIGGTTTAVVSELILVGNNNFIGGNGNLLINAQITGTGGFTTIGTGTVELTNDETYTGQTTLGAGSTLELGTGYSSVASIGGAGSVIVAGSGTQIFAGLNTYTGTTTINMGSTLQLGNGVTDGSILSSTSVVNNGSLVFDTMGSQNLTGNISGSGAITMNGIGNQEISGVNNYTGSTIINSGTLQLGSTTALGNTPAITVSGSGALNFSNGINAQTTNLATNGQTLTLSNGSILAFGATNTSADLLDISNGAVLTLNGTTYISISLLSGTGGSYTIITDSNPFQGSGTFALAPLPALATGTLTQTGSTVSISFTGVSTVYWEGSGTSGRGNWGDYTNFTSDAAGTVKLTGTFGPEQDIIFSASGATRQTNNALNTNVSARSLTINDPSGVDISTAAFNFYTLTLAGSGTSHTGVTVGSAAGALGNQTEIDANIDLAGTPNITVNSTAGLLITGGISGTAGILVNGANTLTLTGSDTFSGGVDLVSGTLSVSSDGAFGQSGAGNLVTFNPGAGNSVTLQQNYGAPSNTNNLSTAANRTFDFVSGTGIIDPGPAGEVMTIGGPVIGSGAMELVDSGQLILSGSVAFSGTAFVTSGTLTLSFPGTLAQAGPGEFRISPGAVLQLSDALSNQNISSGSGDPVAFTGSGTLQVTGLDTLQLHGNAAGNIYIDMGAGSTIEVVEGMLENGGPGAPIATEGDPTNGNGSPLWTGTYNGAAFTNLSSLQIDATGTFDTWNGNNVMIDALNGSGVLTRLGYSNTEVGSIVYIGDNNGSGEFDGIITNLYGSLSIVKEGSGTEIFTGNNSYSGSTLVSGGILRVENNNGLGFGGPVYYTGTNTANQANGTVTVTGSSTLDLNGSGTNGAIVVDKVIVLNGATLVNNGAGSMATLDSGVAAVTIGGTQSGTYSLANLAVSGTAPGNGSGASFAAGTGTAAGGAAVFGEVTAPGTGYTIAPTLVYSDQTGTGSGVTATAILSSLSLGGSTTDYIGGSGTLVVNAVISGSDGFTTTGTGTLILNGSNTYAGATIVATDTVQNNGYITGVVNVNPTGGGISTLSGTGIFGGLVSTAAAGGGNVAHIAPGVNAPGSNFGGAGTLTMKNSLVLGNGTNLDYDLGANTAGNSDQIVVSGSLSLGSGIALNIGQLAGFSQGTYVLMTYTGALSGNTGSWTVSGLPNDTATLSTSTAGEVTLTISGVNDSQLVISPAPIQLGSVLVGYEALSSTVTLSNTDALANGSTAHYTNVTGGNVTVSPSSGTLASNTSTNLTVGTGTISGQSGNGVVIGTLASTNSSNASGSAAPVTVEANVYQPFSGSTSVVATSGSTATLYDTNAANTDGGGGQRAGATISAYNSPNANFVITPDPTSLGVIPTSSGEVSSGSTSVAEVAPAADLLNGTYNTTETITGTAAYSDPQLAQEASVAGQVWNNVTLSATISGVVSTGSTNVYSAQILSGSSYAGYSLSSGVVGTTHTNTGPGGLVATTATLLAGTASATNTVNMSFDITPGTGSDNAFRTSDILTLTGLAPRGTALEDGQTIQLTDEFVLQMTYDVGAAGTEYIAENTYNGWINAVLLNGPQNANSLNPAPYNEPYSTYAAANPNFSSQLGAYGYYQGVAWAVLDNTGPADPISEYAVIPEPGTYALIFGGFGMLAGFRRLRRRRRS